MIEELISELLRDHRVMFTFVVEFRISAESVRFVSFLDLIPKGSHCIRAIYVIRVLFGYINGFLDGDFN